MERQTASYERGRCLRHDLTAIVLVAAVTHGLLLLMDGVYYDDYLLHGHLNAKDWSLMHEWISQAGLALAVGYYRVLGMLPNIVLGCRLAAFLALTLTAVLWYLTLRDARVLSRWECLAVALVQLTFPAFRTPFLLVVLIYVVCYTLFVAGVYMAVRSYGGHGRGKLALRLGSLIAFFAGFSANSLLVFYAGFIVFMVFLVRRVDSISFWAAAKRYLPRHADFLLLPIAYWGIRETFAPRWGVYAKYNVIQTSLKDLALRYAEAVPNVSVLQVNDVLLRILAFPGLWLALIAVLGLLCAKLDKRTTVTFDSPASPRSMIAVGGALVLIAVLPYVLVGKTPTVVGWNTRHALLVSIGAGVLIVGVFKAFCTGPERRLPRSGVVALAGLLLAFAATMIESYASWQMRWVKDSSVRLHLAKMAPCAASTYWIDEQFALPREVSVEPLQDYEWATIFKNAWGGDTRTGLYLGEDLAAYDATRGESYRTTDWGRICNLGGYDAEGPQARLTIRPGPRAGGVDMVLWYWWYRHVNPKRFEAFLKDVASVTLSVLPEAQNTDGPGTSR